MASPAEDLQNILVIELYRLPAPALDRYVDSELPEVRARTALALGRLSSSPGRVSRLSTLLGDEDEAVRRAAAFGLGLTEGGAVPLVQALTSERDPEIRAAIYAALGHRARPEDVSVLVEGLRGSASEAREAAVSLGRMGIAEIEPAADPQVLDALIGQLTRLDPRAREGAAFALARLEAVDDLDRSLADGLLLRERREPDPTVRAWLTRAMTGAAPDQAAAALSRARVDPDVGVRIAAAGLAGALGDGEALAALLGDGDWSVRLAAIQATGGADGIDHRALLAPFLESGSADLAAAAITALGQQGLADSPRPWLQPEQPLPVQAAAVGTLVDLEQLTRLALESTEAPLRTAAASRLVELEVGGDTLSALLDAKDSAVASAAADWLAEVPDPALLGAIMARMSRGYDPDFWLEGFRAIQATLALQGVPRPEGLEALVDEGLTVRDPAVRVIANNLAAELKIDRSLPPPHFLSGLPTAGEILALQSARILTDAGEIRVQLFPELAPLTVLNFAQLAERGYFDGLSVHRVVPDFVVQAGCPRGDGWGGPGYSIPDELSWLPYDEGSLGMALSGPDTGGSQWFVTLSPQPQLEGQYPIFGRVSLDNGAAHRVRQGAVIQDVIIERVAPAQ